MENKLIHPTAVIEHGANISDDVSVGPFSYIGSQVTLCSGVKIKSHVVVTGATEIGEKTVVYSFAVIGEIPQDLKFNGEKTNLKIGKRNQIREHVTINTGTKLGGGLTSIGNDCLFMTGSHVAHDVKINNKVIIATYGVASVGINIPRIFNLVLIEPGKSFVRVIQSIGRGIRKAKDKDFVQIWDITSSCKFAKRHLTHRKKFYKEANYPFTIEKLDWS